MTRSESLRRVGGFTKKIHYPPDLIHVAGHERRISVGDAVVIKSGERHFVPNDTDAELRLIVTCTSA